MNYKYQCVVGPANVSAYNAKEVEGAVKVFEDIINREAAQGWEYVGIDEFTTTQQPGCLAFFSGPTTHIQKMLIFRKPA